MGATHNPKSVWQFSRAICLVGCLLTLASGCTYNVYELDLSADSDGLNRQLTCWRKSNNKVVAFAEPELQRIAELYGAAVELPLDRYHTFQASFNGELPQDIGGAGYFARTDSPLGDLFVYQERFRGQVDVVATLDRRRAAADALTDLVIGWFENELGSDPGFPQLRTFLDTEFRQDLKNLGLQTWLASFKPEETPMRVGQYLVERGYGSPSEILALFSGDQGGERVAGQIVPRFVAKKLGHLEEEPPRESLAFLRSSEAMQSSLGSYLQTTPEYRRRRAEWEQAKLTKPDAPEPNPIDLFTEALGRSLLSGPVLEASDELKITLHTGAKPFWTNGKWYDSEQQVMWDERLSGSDGPAPFCYALWSEPNRDAQRQTFGRVLLTGEDLGKYAAWYARLDAEQRPAWDRFLATLKPGLGLEARIYSFRFASDPPVDDPNQPPPSAADVAKELLLKKLMPQ